MMIDAQGKSTQMTERRWASLVGKSASSDHELRTWGESFSRPPSEALKGAQLDVPAYVQERRAIRLIAHSHPSKSSSPQLETDMGLK